MKKKPIYIKPNDPAVIPTPIKNPNSARSLEPGGIEFKSSANGSIILKFCYISHYLLTLVTSCSTFFSLVITK